jgi:hypothetical protein
MNGKVSLPIAIDIAFEHVIDRIEAELTGVVGEGMVVANEVEGLIARRRD